MSKIWHLTLTRATHAPQVTFRSSGGGEVTVTRGKITTTNIDLGSTLNSSLIRVIRVEDRHKEAVQGESNRVDAMVKNVKPLPPAKPVMEEPAPIPVVEPPAIPVVEPQIEVEEPKAEIEPVVQEEPKSDSEPSAEREVASEAKVEAESSEDVPPPPPAEENPEEEPKKEEAKKPARKRTTRKRTTRKKTTKSSS